MKLGSLFDGIGTFPLSGLQHGIIPVWASEIEAFPIKVTKHHFPDMKHLGDVTQINGAEIEPVDIITFGSPCQNLSVAGKREGLAGAMSGLFMEAVRIIREMRTATDGQYPRFAVWENVPGAFSSNKGEDFRAVLEEITEAEIPMPRSGKWATAGMVRTERVDVAWRVLDAQYWGVPQRRRRIFLVADFAGECAGEILFERQGVSGDSAESGSEGQEVAGNVGTGATESSRINSTPEGVSGAVSSKWAKGTGGPAGDECYNLVVEPRSADGIPRWNTEGIVPTLNTSQGGQRQPCVISIQNATRGKSQNGLGISQDDVSCTLDSLGNHAICLQGSMIGRADKNGPQGDGVNEEVSFTLNTTDRHAVATRYAVRRLTPLECERLQGLPDNWTNIEGASDTARYKAIGNGIAKPCSDFVIGRIAEVLRRTA